MVSSQPQDVLWGTSRIASQILSVAIYILSHVPEPSPAATRMPATGAFLIAIVLADLLRCDVGKLSVLGPSDRQKTRQPADPAIIRDPRIPRKTKGFPPPHSDGLLTGNGHFGGGDRGRAWRRCWRLVTRAEAGTLKCLARAVFGSMAGRFTALVAMLYWRL